MSIENGELVRPNDIAETESDKIAITIRLPRELLADLTLLAEYKGVPYQTMLNEALHMECKKMVRELALEHMKVEIAKRAKKSGVAKA